MKYEQIYVNKIYKFSSLNKVLHTEILESYCDQISDFMMHLFRQIY